MRGLIFRINPNGDQDILKGAIIEDGFAIISEYREEVAATKKLWKAAGHTFVKAY